MHVVIAGGNGFVGQALQHRLLSEGVKVSVLTRKPPTLAAGQAGALRYIRWLTDGSRPETELGQIDAIVNLSGESLNGLRWTQTKKHHILQSRLATTREIARIISLQDHPPKVLINASAVGYYGMSPSVEFEENVSSTADDFLATVVKAWEVEAMKVASLGVRTVLARFGVVLGKGGALPLMALPYKLGVGGTIGSGRQWLSWVHIEDAVSLIRLAIDEASITGPLNITAPHPIQMKDFGQTIGRVLRRPHWLPVPSFALQLALGEMSSMLLSGQRVIPAKALDHHFKFIFPDAKTALQHILNK